MSVEDASNRLLDGQSLLDRTVCKSSSHDSLDTSNKLQNEDGDQSSKTTEASPKVHPMSFTIDFGDGKQVDKSRLEELAKKSKARHQRIQSMSAGSTRTSPVVTKPPISVKLPRKAQGYNSEGYFSSDQEDGYLSASLKLKQSPLAQNFNKTHTTLSSSFGSQHNVKSPITEPIQFRKPSKSPIVDSIMSRSETLPSRQSLNLPLKNINSSYLRDVHKTPSYGNLSSSYQPRSVMPDVVNQNQEAVMLADISSPELDILTPDNGLATPEHIPRSPVIRNVRAQSEIPEMLFKKCSPHIETLYIDDEVDRESNNSSTGTYTIEGDNYTEEQKARMSIDRKMGMDMMTDSMKDNLIRGGSAEKDPELIFDHPPNAKPQRVRSPLVQQATFDIPNRVSTDKNVLEISCSYGSPTDNDLAAQTSKQIKSTRNYLEKIKNRVKTITEKTFSKHTEPNADLGNFTSVTTSGVLSSKHPPRLEFHNRRRCSLTKSEIDQTDYVHRLTRESSVPISLNSKLPFEDAKFESTALKNAHKALRDDNGISKPPEVVGRLSHLSLNRCKGDKTWIQDWADSVKEYNNNTLGRDPAVNNFIVDVDRLPTSPRWEVASKCTTRNEHGTTPTKIPSPKDPRRMTPDLIPATQDTEAYLKKTQNAITNLQAKLNSARNTHNTQSILTSSYHSGDKTSRLPVAQLSRSNSLNYRLRRKPSSEVSSPLRCPGSYVITGQNVPESTKLLLNSASRSLDDRKKDLTSPERIALSNITHHTRHKSFDGRNLDCFTDTAKINNNEKIDLTRNHGDVKRSHQRFFSDGIDKTKPMNNIAFGTSMRRSSSFNTVRQNNNYIDVGRINQDAYKKNVIRPDLKSIVPANSPRCPNTPEMQRKFGPGLVRASCRTNKERPVVSRMSEPPMARDERGKPTNHNSRRVEPRQVPTNRLTKSRSSTREFQPKGQEKGKPSQHRSSSALAAKEAEFTNWKKRSTYDPMKAAREGRRRQQTREGCKDDLSSPSHSSPVHRSQSYHATNLLDVDTLDYSSEGTEEDQLTLPVDNPMITSTHSDNLDVRRTDYRELRRQAMNNDVVINRDYTPGFRINEQSDTLKRRDVDKRRTFILDDVTPTRENVDLVMGDGDKRRTFVLDSDTNSTTNGSSPRNSSIFSHEKNSLTICTSDTEGESGPESAPVVLRHPPARRAGDNKHRYSGDYSMSSSTTSISQQPPGRRKEVQPRYLDISKYKNETSPKTFLRRDPSKTYVGVLPEPVSKGSAQQYELEQKKQELEKWKRRASYDPRKSAAQARAKPSPKTTSNVLRSQSFHGPMILSNSYKYLPNDQIVENYDPSSDNDF